MDPNTGHITPSSPAPGPMPPSLITTTPSPRARRVVDLGREDAMVPWAEWFHRASHGMDLFVEQGVMPRMARTFRVTLADGRPFAVFSVKTHIAKGKCSTGGAWHEPSDGGSTPSDACDVITGYSLVGTASDGRPCVLTVPPVEIASVECVLVEGGSGETAGEGEDAETVPFGFAAFAHRKDTPEYLEEEEPTPFSSVI